MKLTKITACALMIGAVAFTSCQSDEERAAREQLNELFGDLESSMENLGDELEENMSDNFVDEPEAEKYTSEDGKFSIKFPGNPQVSTDDVPTDVGTIQMKSFMYEKSAKEAFMVAYSDYPAAMVAESDPDQLLEGGKGGALSSFGITTTDEEKDLEIDGNPGKYFKANNGQYYVVYEMYMVDNRLYQIAILRDGMYPSKEESNKFIGSFELN